MNSCCFVGRITKELEIKPAGENEYVRFSIAIDRPIKNKAGEKVTDFIPVKVWGDKARNLVKYSGKGKLVSVKGELQISPYEKDGEKRTSFEILAEEVGFLEWNKKNDDAENA